MATRHCARCSTGSHAAVVDANREDFDAELHQRHPEVVPGDRLVVLILGPASWWTARKTCAAAGSWAPAFNGRCRDLTRRLDLTIACAALDDFDVSHLVLGLNGSEPFLTITRSCSTSPDSPPYLVPVTADGRDLKPREPSDSTALYDARRRSYTA